MNIRVKAKNENKKYAGMICNPDRENKISNIVYIIILGRAI